MQKEQIFSSANLHDELNEERRKQGLGEVPKINPRGCTNHISHNDKSYKNVVDFFLQKKKSK